jgi:hypothetical protein
MSFQCPFIAFNFEDLLRWVICWFGGGGLGCLGHDVGHTNVVIQKPYQLHIGRVQGIGNLNSASNHFPH